LTVYWAKGLVINQETGFEMPFEPLTRAEMEMLQTGGLVPYLKKSLGISS